MDRKNFLDGVALELSHEDYGTGDRGVLSAKNVLGTGLHAEVQSGRKTLPLEFTSQWGEQTQTREWFVVGRRGCAPQRVRLREMSSRRTSLSRMLKDEWQLARRRHKERGWKF